MPPEIQLAKGIAEVIPGETTLSTWTERGVGSVRNPARGNGSWAMGYDQPKEQIGHETMGNRL
jgi:hypothetical protein